MQPDFTSENYDTFAFAESYRKPPPLTGPIPPSLHWALVLILSIASLGLFSWIWIFVQARFVKKIDPAGYASLWLVAWSVFGVLGVTARFTPHQMGFAPIFRLLAGVLYVAALFSMKRSLESYYNREERIGLQLSGVLVYFFSILYFQHHLRRIAVWRRTGMLA